MRPRLRPRPRAPHASERRGLQHDRIRLEEFGTGVAAHRLVFTPPRLDEPELLDEHDAPRADMERSLRDLRRINRYLGGVTTYRRLLKRFTSVKSIVDLGAGTADLLETVPGDILRVA